MANAPENTGPGGVARSATPLAEVPRIDKKHVGGSDELSQAELERELEELWLKHVEPHFPKPATSC